jgi:hypothetical protein
MRTACLIVATLLAGGCASGPPREQVDVSEQWRQIRYEKLFWHGRTSITIERWPHVASGYASFEIRERLKLIGDSEMLTPEQMSSLTAILPIGSALAGDGGLIADAMRFTISVDGQSATVNHSSADPQMKRVIDWFEAYAETHRHSATTRPWLN